MPELRVKLLTHTPDPQKIMAAAAKLCYARADIDTVMDGLTPEKTDDFIEMLSSLGHESPMEHMTFTFEPESSIIMSTLFVTTVMFSIFINSFAR